MSLLSFLSRVQNRICTVAIQKLHETQFTASNHQTLRYMFLPSKSDILVVGFQACNDAGARYNYVKTLRDCHVNCLFIKDDFGPTHYGDFYLGCNGTYSVETATFELIDHYINKLSPRAVFFVGSSKGGYSALNFGLRYRDANIVVAAPQYFLATCLYGGRWTHVLDEILGEPVTPQNMQKLDNRLRSIVKNDPYATTQRVYIHYSTKEHTYEEHIKYLLEDLREKEISVEENVETYPNHADLKYYFPQYLKACILSQT